MISDEDLNKVLKEYSLSSKSKLPKIKVKDSALAELGAKSGDVVEITRQSFAGKSKYYRLVVD